MCLKADDVLVRDVTFFERDVCLVTADNELMSRCRSTVYHANHKKKEDKEEEVTPFEIQFVHPLTFLCELENVVTSSSSSSPQNTETYTNNGSSTMSSTITTS